MSTTAGMIMSQVLRHVFQLFLLSCLEVAARGTEVKMQPIDILVEVGNLATFTCDVSCELDNTHTIKWFVGDSPSSRRLVDPAFEKRTGIHVFIEELANCATVGQKTASQMLSVNVSSVDRLNRTAVQCSALRKSPLHSDIYSHYGVILVNDVVTSDEGDSTLLSTVQPPPTDIRPTASNSGSRGTNIPPIEPSPCQTVIVTSAIVQTTTVTVTHTVRVTNEALPPQISRQSMQCSGSGTLQRTATSSLILLCIMILSLL